MRELTMEEVGQVAGGLTGTAGWPYGPSGSSDGSVFSSNGFAFWAGLGSSILCVTGTFEIVASDGTMSLLNGTKTVAACLAPAYAIANGTYNAVRIAAPQNSYVIALETDGGRLVPYR
jgi:hypothetical protein